MRYQNGDSLLLAFLEGRVKLTSGISIFPSSSLTSYKFPSDGEAMASDMAAIGGDFRRAIEQVVGETQTPQKTKTSRSVRKG